MSHHNKVCCGLPSNFIEGLTLVKKKPVRVSRKSCFRSDEISTFIEWRLTATTTATTMTTTTVMTTATAATTATIKYRLDQKLDNAITFIDRKVGLKSFEMEETQKSGSIFLALVKMDPKLFVNL